MKTVCLVFLTMICAALLHGTVYAAQSSPASQLKSHQGAAKTVSDRSQGVKQSAPGDDGTHIGKPSDDRQNHHKVSDNNHPTSSPSLSKANRPKQLPNRRARSASANSMNPYRPASNKSGRATKDRLSRDETGNNTLSIRPTVVRPAVPSFNNVRHRDANPAVVGGLGSSNTRNTGAIDGTHISRRH